MQNAVATVNWRRAVTVLGIAVIVAFVLWLLSHIPRTVTIFVIAAFIASAVHPIVGRMESGRLPRAWAIALVYLILILLVIVCAVVVLPLTFTQTQVLAGNIPGYLHVAQGWLVHFADALRARFPGTALPPQLSNIQEVGTQRVSDLVNATLLSLGALAINVATAFFIGFSALILSFFFLLNHRQLADGFSSAFPPSRRQTARMLATEIVAVFGGFISG
ncbi:MAG: AI-2E family transporter, partial [Candidatus Eremiobacteraeota bacterium]|nr:AI-2E family transporter [Candidatus Eremiobacteraeota bacterium]